LLAYGLNDENVKICRGQGIGVTTVSGTRLSWCSGVGRIQHRRHYISSGNGVTECYIPLSAPFAPQYMLPHAQVYRFTSIKNNGNRITEMVLHKNDYNAREKRS
jgi:hypothetical protein